MVRRPTQAPPAPPVPDPPKGERFERLRRARVQAGFPRPRDAIERFGWNRNTYKSNENGNAPFSFDQAKLYARAYAVGAEWLYDGSGPMRPGDPTSGAPPSPPPATVPIVGYVSAGARAHLFAEGQGPLGHVSAPDDAGPRTVAVEIRGESLGPFFVEWLVFYDDVRSPVTADLHGRLCVVGLPDGRVLVKKLQPSRAEGAFHLLSQNEDPLLDQAVAWAASVTGMRPR
jgi:hypothetical protein